MTRPVLIADVGGTNARVALARADGSFDSTRTVKDEEAESLEGVLARSLKQFEPERPETCVLAVAGPVDGDYVTFTNRASWSFSQRKLRRVLQLKRLVVVNDFVAAAYALPVLRPHDLMPVGGGRSEPRRTMFICGPGTGFGAAVLLRHGRRPHAMATEAGHMRLAAATTDEARVVAHLVREEQAPVGLETVLSGPGLSRLHSILAGKQLSPQAVIDAAQNGDPRARESVDFFLRLYGRIAGDLALAFDARGGVFIAGGVGRALAPLFASSPFRAAFEEHPPFEARLAAVPTQIIVHSEPGLLGAAALARLLPESKRP